MKWMNTHPTTNCTFNGNFFKFLLKNAKVMENFN